MADGGRRRAVWLAALLATTALGAAPRAEAQGAGAAQSDQHSFDIPAQPLAEALIQFGRQSGRQATAEAGLVANRRSMPVKGTMSWQDALAALLSGSGLTWRASGGMVVVERLPQAGSGAHVLAPITVEGQAAAAARFGDAPAEPGGFKAEYQTTATKSAQSIRETPQSIGVVTQDLMRARQVTDLSQAIETIAGVTQYSGPGPFAGHDGFGFGDIQIRGITSDYLTDPREDGYTSPVFSAPPDLAPYERIEVVKGPSSVLYGRGSAGGFLNRVRKKPLPHAQSEVEATVGSYDLYRVDADATGPMFDTGKVRGRIVAAYQSAGSFVDDVESERLVLAPSLEVDLTETTRLLLQTSYQHDNYIPNPGVPLRLEGGKYVAPDISRSLFVGTPNDDDVNLRMWGASAQLDQEIDDDWLATLRLNRSGSRNPTHLDSYAYGVNAAGDVNLYAGDFNIDTDVWSGELRMNGDLRVLDRPTRLTYGVDHTDLRHVNDQSYTYIGTANIYLRNFDQVPTVPTTPSFNGLYERQGTGVYGQVDIQPVDRLHLLLGGRYDWTETSLAERVNGTEDRAKEEAFTARAGVVLDVTRNVSVFGLYAQSFNPVLEADRDGQILPAEEGEIYELGIKTEWLDKRLGINASVFRIDRTNVPVPDEGPGNFSVSGGTQRSDGVELEINGEILPGWQVSFAGTLLDSSFTEASDPDHGNQPSGSSDWQVGLYTSYEIQEGALQGVGAGVGFFGIGERGLSRPATLDGYERLDLGAFYNGIENVTLRLQVRNVLDERYIEGADRPNYAQFGSPRAVVVSGGVRF